MIDVLHREAKAVERKYREADQLAQQLAQQQQQQQQQQAQGGGVSSGEVLRAQAEAAGLRARLSDLRQWEQGARQRLAALKAKVREGKRKGLGGR